MLPVPRSNGYRCNISSVVLICIKSQLHVCWFKSATQMCCRFAWSTTLVCTLTRMSGCRHTSLPLWDHVSQGFSNYAARCRSRHTMLTLIHALVISKVVYFCSMLTSISGHLLDRLQSVLNTATQLMFSARPFEHITLLLCNLYWLWVSEHIRFHLYILTHYCLNRTAPFYIA